MEMEEEAEEDNGVEVDFLEEAEDEGEGVLSWVNQPQNNGK